MQVVSLVQYKNRELIAVLKELLQLAESGQAQGLAFVVKVGRRRHYSGLTGDYSRSPDEAIPAVVRLKETLLQQEPEESADEGESWFK